MGNDPSQDLVAVRKIIGKRLRPGMTVTDDAPLYSSGLLDSMSIVDLILDLESSFGVSIPGTEIQTTDLDSIARIAATVARFRGVTT